MERLNDYDYTLPQEAIAQRPLTDRAASRLLWLHRHSGEVEHLGFRQVVDILQSGDLLVLNNTRVTALRLFGTRPTGGQVELLLLRELEPGAFEALARPGKRLKPGSEVVLGPELTGKIVENLAEGRKLVRLASERPLQEALRSCGTVPLPPYVRETLRDPERYQTVYAEKGGSAAAPTAGLHFTEEILSALKNKGVATATVTLNVGIDTFRPVQVENPADHPIHGEACEVPQDTVEAVERCTGRIVAVGTTAVRTLESFAIGKRRLEAGRMETRLFIRPGYEFRIVDGMFTNFHMPRTTMLMMISALAGRENVMSAYREALAAEYRFLSFGDSMLIL